MGHRFGMNIVADGVETIAELDAMRQSGCEDVQGYYFSKPLAARDVQQWVRNQRVGLGGRDEGDVANATPPSTCPRLPDWSPVECCVRHTPAAGP